MVKVNLNKLPVFGQESCPAGESSSAKSLVQLGNTFNKRIKRLKLSNIENNCDMLCLFVVIM